MKSLLIVVYLARFAAAYQLSYLNLRHLRRHGASIPEGFSGSIDLLSLSKSARYTVDSSKVALIRSVYQSALLLGFLFTPLFSGFDAWTSSLTGSFVIQGMLFILLLTLAEEILSIPFSLYSTFRIEKRYGFNTITGKLWIADFFKSTILSTLLLAILSFAALTLVERSPDLWWLWVWCFFAFFSITMIYLSPYLIEPLFSKFDPLDDPQLEEEISLMLAKEGLQVKGVMKMDASRRTLHSNAYFTGLGRVKRIVLFDTLIKQMERPELLAILAHEAGHWKRGHLWKRLVVMQGCALAVIYGVFLLTSWGGMPGLFGLAKGSFAAQLVMVSFLLSIVLFPFTPLISWLSRRHEWEADRFAANLCKTPEPLACALVKLSKENLANLHPHPLYAWFYYSHPPVIERVARLRCQL